MTEAMRPRQWSDFSTMFTSSVVTTLISDPLLVPRFSKVCTFRYSLVLLFCFWAGLELTMQLNLSSADPPTEC